MPGDTYAPLILALALTALFVGALLLAWWLIFIGLAVSVLAAIMWLWPERSLSQIVT